MGKITEPGQVFHEYHVDGTGRTVAVLVDHDRGLAPVIFGFLPPLGVLHIVGGIWFLAAVVPGLAVLGRTDGHNTAGLTVLQSSLIQGEAKSC